MSTPDDDYTAGDVFEAMLHEFNTASTETEQQAAIIHAAERATRIKGWAESVVEQYDALVDADMLPMEAVIYLAIREGTAQALD